MGGAMGMTARRRAGIRWALANVTLGKDFATRSASIVLQSTTICEVGIIDLWFDKAFGSFLWVTHLINPC